MRADWENIRNEEFPAANKNVQLKSGGGSPISKSAYEAAKKYFDDMLHYGDIFWIENLEKVERIRSKVAKYLNSRREEVGFLINSSSCMKVVLHYLDHGEVLYPEQEFPTSIHDIKRANIKLHPIIPLNNRYPITEIRKAINNNTSSFITSHIQYLTGFRPCFPLIAALTYILTLPNIFEGITFMSSFWLGSSVYFPLIGMSAGILSSMGIKQSNITRIRRISGIALFITGLYLIILGTGFLSNPAFVPQPP